MELQPMLDAPLPTQDGGKSSDMRVATLSTINQRSLKFRTKTWRLMLKQETSWLATEEVTSDNNGKSSMSMNTRNQERVN
jgi:hypothetical protein